MTPPAAPILTPNCPLCSQPPGMVIIGGTQAFCGNDDCPLLLWDQAESLDGNLLNAGVVDLTPEPKENGNA